MKERKVELAVGVFLIAGLLCVGYLAVRLGEVEWFQAPHYELYARFQSVSGLTGGAHVEMAGVHIGKVQSISLDLEREMALVKLRIHQKIELTEDVIASVKTSGLIGDKYIQLTPGSSPAFLEPGGFITETESSVDVEELLSKYVFGNVE